MAQHSKQLIQDNEARAALLSGAKFMYDSVVSSYGPRGVNSIIQKTFGFPLVTRDGVTIARETYTRIPEKNLGAQLLLQASEETNRVAGDGPQPLWAKVLSPTGFVPMGDIETGMEVCGTNGSIQTVLGVYEKGEKEIYKVTLTDGRVVECCADHLWTVTDSTNEGIARTLTVRRMLETGLTIGREKNSHKYYIQRNEVEFKQQSENMPIDSYTLGALLGDGALSGTMTVELALGFKKRHILEKIKLPEGAIFRSTDREKYIRVKIPGRPMVDALKKVGLYGTKSEYKFIPEAYLYSSIESRKALLQGLLDTDGYINSKGVFEFSTVSPQLAADFSDLCRGLGYDLYTAVLTKNDSSGSYSRRPIFRIIQLKGRKFGMAIDSIEATGETTQMRCIKVSNADELYITDGYIVTHNTTATVGLAYQLMGLGVQAIAGGRHPMEVKDQIMADVELLVGQLEGMASLVKHGQLKQVATVSSGNALIGQLIAEAVEYVGDTGGINVEKAPIASIERVYQDGYFIQSGFETSQTPRKELNNPFVLVVQRRLTTHGDAVTLLNNTFTRLSSTPTNTAMPLGPSNPPLIKQGDVMPLIIIGNIEEQAYTTIANMMNQGVLDGAIIKPPMSFGAMGTQLLEDIAIYAGCEPIIETTNLRDISIDLIGHSLERVVVTKSESTLFGLDNSSEAVQDRIKTLKAQIEAEEVDAINERLKDRLAKLEGKIAIFRIGGATNTVKEETEFRVEDAILATRAASRYGVVPGGGITLLELSKTKGLSELTRNALQAVFKQLLINANLPAELKLDEALKAEAGYGFNLRAKGELVDMIKAGILDPSLVVEQIIRNGCSQAAELLAAGNMLVFEEDKEDGR